MIKFIIKLSVLLTVTVLNICKTNNSKDNDSSTLETPYFIQKPPGLTPKPFTPGLVSTDLYKVNSAFTPDIKALYFIRRGDEHKKSAFYEYKYYKNSRNWEKLFDAEKDNMFPGKKRLNEPDELSHRFAK